MNIHQINDPRQMANELVSRARAAQAEVDSYDQDQTDLMVAAAGWAIMEPERNRRLAELSVADTGLGNVPDKITKNYRKTLGLLRDLKGAKSVGITAEYPDRGLVEIARPVGVVLAITPSTNPAATPANKIINALKGRNAIIVAPSPKGWRTCAMLLDFIHAELVKISAPRDLVQLLPAPVTKEATQALMQAADLIVATGSQSNIRAAYSSGTPAFGVGAGNVAVIIDASAELDEAAAKIVISKTFDNATSCSSENSVVIDTNVYDPMIAALEREGAVLLNQAEKDQLQSALWPEGRLAPNLIAKDAPTIARSVGLERFAHPDVRVLMVEETGTGPDYPYSGEKLSPVLTVYRSAGFEDACRRVEAIYAYQGAGHSVGLHSRQEGQALELGLRLPVARVIVNQAHCLATGGNFDNALPFSLSMGCGTWGGNNFSENLNYRHYLNTTRVVGVVPASKPTEDEIFSSLFAKVGR